MRVMKAAPFPQFGTRLVPLPVVKIRPGLARLSATLAADVERTTMERSAGYVTAMEK